MIVRSYFGADLKKERLVQYCQCLFIYTLSIVIVPFFIECGVRFVMKIFTKQLIFQFLYFVTIAVCFSDANRPDDSSQCDAFRVFQGRERHLPEQRIGQDVAGE